MKKVLGCFAGLLFLVAPLLGQDQIVVYSGPGVDLTDRSNPPAWGSFSLNRVFIFSPLNPDQSMCLFISNNNPTNSHSFTLNVFQTGDKNVRDYSNNTGRWIADTVQGTASPVAANSTNTVFVHSNAAVKVAVQITGSTSAAGSPDTADVYLVQTNATGCGPVGSGSTTVNLGQIAGTNVPSTTGRMPIAVGSTDIDGRANNVLSSLDGTVNPGGLDINPKVFNGTTWDRLRGSVAGRPIGTLAISQAGATFSDLARTVTANVQVELTTSAGELVNFNVCSVTLAVTGTVSGTTPTLNVRIQVSADGTTWDDRISFGQATATNFFQEASISSGSLAVTTYAQNTLAAASIVDGTFPGRMRINYTIGGTGSPSFGGVNVRAVCK